MEQDKNGRILHERAAALAREYVGGEERGDLIECTVFQLGSERYAIESHLIREVVACGGYTPLPCVSLHVAGVMNLRGRILALVDLQRLLELPGDASDVRGAVLVLAHGGMEFGVIVHAIEGNMRIAPPSPGNDFPSLAWAGGTYLRGVTSERLILLDAHKLLHDPALVVNEEIH